MTVYKTSIIGTRSFVSAFEEISEKHLSILQIRLTYNIFPWPFYPPLYGYYNIVNHIFQQFI